MKCSYRRLPMAIMQGKGTIDRAGRLFKQSNLESAESHE